MVLHRLFAERALLPGGWAGDVLLGGGRQRLHRGRHAGERRRGFGRGGGARGRPGDSRHGEPAQSCLSACHGGSGRAGGQSGRLLLDLARPDVPLRRAARPAADRGRRNPALRRAGQGRLHRGRGVSLSAPRARRRALRGSGGDGQAPAGRRPDGRYRDHAAAGALRLRAVSGGSRSARRKRDFATIPSRFWRSWPV